MSIKASNNPFPHDPDDNWKEKLDRGGYPGTAKDLFDKISQIDAPDGILIAGEITRIGNVFSIGASTFTCRIKQEELVNQDDFSTTIVNASDNYKRIDILVFTKFSTIIKIQGDEDLVSAKEPDVPTGTIKLAFFSIFGNQVDEHNEPIIIPDISEKLDRGGFEGTAQDIVNAIPDPSEFWRKLDKDGYDGTAKTLKDEIDSGLLLKENKANKATDFTVVNDQLYPTVKGSKTYVDNGLSLKENLSNKAVDFSVINDLLYPTIKGVKNQLDTKISASEKGAVNGVATIGNDGKIPNSQIPALAISETFPVNSQFAMLALSQAEQGDIAIRSDLSKSFILRVSPASVLGNWSELLTPTDSVQSVNGQVGNVNLTTVDVQDSTNKRYQTDSQKLFNDATSSIQAQFNSKQANLGFTPEPAFIKNTAFNKNFGSGSGTVAEGNDVRILNGQTAFGWGNHASAGYAFSNGSNASGNWAINITGNSASATNWGGYSADFTTVESNVPSYITGFYGSVSRIFNAPQVKSFLGLSSAITGTGTTNFIPKFTGSGIIGNSNIFDNGNIGFGTSSPTSIGAGYVSLEIKGTNGAGIIFAQTGQANNFIYSNTVGLNIDATSVPIIMNTSGSERLRVATNGNVAIGTTTALSGGGASKWLTIDGTTTYGGGFISSINGVGKGFYYYDNGFAIVQGSAGSGVSLNVNGGSNGLTIQSNGNSTFAGTVTAPTFNGALNGNASSASSATTWDGQQYLSVTEIGTPQFLMTYDSTVAKWKPALSGTIKTFLGLGSNAYSSTAYLPTLGKISTSDTNLNFPTILMNGNSASGGGVISMGAGGATYTVLSGEYESVNNGQFIFRTLKNNALEIALKITSSGNTIVSGNITASGGFFNSDERLKDIISRDGNVAYFKWKDGRDDKTHIGYIAQEVQKTNPNQVIEGEDGILSVNYIEILIQEIQSLKKEIQEMKGGNYGVC